MLDWSWYHHHQSCSMFALSVHPFESVLRWLNVVFFPAQTTPTGTPPCGRTAKFRLQTGPTMDSNGWADACPVPHVQARAEFSMQVVLSSVIPHVWAQYIFIVQTWASFTLVRSMSSFVSMMHMLDCTLWLAQLVNGIACRYCHHVFRLFHWASMLNSETTN